MRVRAWAPASSIPLAQPPMTSMVVCRPLESSTTYQIIAERKEGSHQTCANNSARQLLCRFHPEITTKVTNQGRREALGKPMEDKCHNYAWHRYHQKEYPAPLSPRLLCDPHSTLAGASIEKESQERLSPAAEMSPSHCCSSSGEAVEGGTEDEGNMLIHT